MAKGNKNPQQVTEKYLKRIKSSTDEIKAGIQSVTEAPGAKAAKKKAKLVQNWQTAIESGKWERNVAAVSLEEWKKQALEKGVNRIGTGAEAAKDKVLQFQTQLLEFQKGLKAKVDNMDDSTPEARQAKMIAWSEGMSKFKRSRG